MNLRPLSEVKHTSYLNISKYNSLSYKITRHSMCEIDVFAYIYRKLKRRKCMAAETEVVAICAVHSPIDTCTNNPNS